MDLNGKVAIITGGGTGIGEAVARRFVADGAKVCITGRRQQVLEQVAETLPSGMVKTCAADVSEPKDVERMVETALSFGTGLQVIVNNAGMEQTPPAGVVDIDVEQWRKVVDVNLTGPFLLMKAAIPHIIKAGGGSVINIASLAGLRSVPELPAYCASKGGLISLTQQAALDYGHYNVRCNVVCPGAVRTAMITGMMEPFAKSLGMDVDGVFAAFSRDVPLQRVSMPKELGGLCSYLASDDSSFLTGVVIPIDGGAAIVDISGAAITNLIGGGKAN
jgi:meso-butanediol dehydrogenase / (S,S)-butanediol dehydrogenase / diacetyl reductase